MPEGNKIWVSGDGIGANYTRNTQSQCSWVDLVDLTAGFDSGKNEQLTLNRDEAEIEFVGTDKSIHRENSPRSQAR